MRKFIYIFILLSLNIYSQDNNQINGIVYGETKDKIKEVLPGANIYWLNTQVGTVSDIEGKFSLNRHPEQNKLVVSFIGFNNDTLTISKETSNLNIVLKSTITLNEVTISKRKETTYTSTIDPVYKQNISGEELFKAACCNLSESFETNASVDVSYSDAVSGAKKIQLLGLAGMYSQLLTENLPNNRGLATPYGLGYIPGPWMESIQVSKGTAEVVSGYESVTGQINVEYLKPDHSDKFYLNLLTNTKGKLEANTYTSVKLNKKWSTMVIAHAEDMNVEHDENNDSFLDAPKLKQVNLLNRWKYVNNKNFMFQFGVKYIDEQRIGGQKSFDKNLKRDTLNGYGININTKRSEAFLKGGYTFNKPGNSIALLTNFSNHQHNSFYGLRDYDAEQNSGYGRIVYNTIIKTTNHKISTGVSYSYDDYDEILSDSTFKRIERVPGTFLQYTLSPSNTFTMIAGIRYDNHSIYGDFVTPRIHAKYNFSETSVVRLSAGKGYRSPVVIAENSFLLASARNFEIASDLKQEEAWNYGINFTKKKEINNRTLTLNAEFYRTDFINQIIIDTETDISEVSFYNLNGDSYSNSTQLEVTYEPIKFLDVTLAYRYNDVKTTINNELKNKPLVNRYKGLATLSYKTKLKKWQFDFTTQVNGNGEIPGTESNPKEYQRPDKYEPYTILNAQITKWFLKWNMYFGVENITSFKQTNPIIAADDPFGEYFDSSMIWGPIHGRKFYIGIRYNIEHKKE